MKMRYRLAAVAAAASILCGCFPAAAVNAKQPPIETTTEDLPMETQDEEMTEDTEATENEETTEDTEVSEIPAQAPAFLAHIEFRMGYTVIGTFTDFTPDIIRIQTLYSTDGKNWQTGGRDWNLYNLNTDNEYLLPGLQNQPCLLSGDEPLKSYIDGKTDRFYLKLRITQKSGLSYETQVAVIERGGLQALPEGTQCRACFSSAVAVSEPASDVPYRYRKYARYQLTVPADATVEDITALLPKTLPVEIQLDHGPDFMAIGVVDCPVTWKPLSLSRLPAGESITVSDAAEEIVVPAGTQVATPLGIFELEKPLSLDTPPSTDEVRLVLNVSEKSKNPSGVLKEDLDGLKIALRQKATGVSSIKAYILAEGESAWTELSGLSLSEEFDQPSTENSGYALLLRCDQEPYRSYLAATRAGETPAPFFVALEFEGGVYDGQQLILSWPDVYEQLPDLPEVKGAEGNEGNAGADNKEDSTESGQRPSLPQPESDSQENGSQENPQSVLPDHNYGEQYLPVPVQETDLAVPEDRTSPTSEALSEGSSVEEGNHTLSDRRSSLPRISPDFSGADQKNSQIHVAPMIQSPSDAEEETQKNDLPLPLLPAAAAVAAVLCIGVVFCKSRGYGPF